MARGLAVLWPSVYSRANKVKKLANNETGITGMEIKRRSCTTFWYDGCVMDFLVYCVPCCMCDGTQQNSFGLGSKDPQSLNPAQTGLSSVHSHLISVGRREWVSADRIRSLESAARCVFRQDLQYPLCLHCISIQLKPCQSVKRRNKAVLWL